MERAHRPKLVLACLARDSPGLASVLLASCARVHCSGQEVRVVVSSKAGDRLATKPRYHFGRHKANEFRLITLKRE